MLRRILIISLTISALIGIYWYVSAGDKQHIQDMAQQIETNINEVEEHQHEMDAKDPDPEENQYSKPQNAQFVFPDEVIKYVFATALVNDIDLFFGNWDANVLLDSFSDYNNMDQEMKEFMDLLTLDGQLQDVGIVDKTTLESSPQLVRVEYQIKLLYGVLKRKDLFIELSQTRDSHGESQWLVTSPLEGLRKQLEH